jgi:predicted deacylase
MTRVVQDRVPWANLPDGTALAFDRIEAVGKADGPATIITAGVHGDEYEGPLAILDLARTLADLPLRGRLTLLPFVNAPALWAGTRTSPLDGLNLARIFPGDATGTLSHRLARAVWAEVSKAQALFDCHSGGVELCFLPVAGFYGEGAGIGAEASDASRALAQATGLPDLWRLPATPGVLSREAAAAGLAVVGCEIGGRGGARPQDVTLYHDALLRALVHLGNLPEGSAPPPPPRQRVLSGDWVTAPASGLLRPLRALGGEVRAGDSVAHIEATAGDRLAVLDAPHDGVILAERNLARVRAGDLAIFVAEVAE